MLGQKIYQKNLICVSMQATKRRVSVIVDASRKQVSFIERVSFFFFFFFFFFTVTYHGRRDADYTVFLFFFFSL